MLRGRSIVWSPTLRVPPAPSADGGVTTSATVVAPPELVATLRAAGCVYAEEEEAALLVASTADPEELAARVARRVAGEPLEHLLGWASFHGLRLRVAPGVFVPRPRSELLARSAVTIARQHTHPVAVDVCCGAGGVAAVLLAEVPGVEVHAVDVDPAAVRCARRNVTGPRAHVYEGDLLTPLPARLRARVDVLVANAPYVPTAAIALMPSEARVHEHRVALDGGPDGLDVQRRLAAGVSPWLAPGGRLLVETGASQAAASATALADVGLQVEVVRDEDLDATVVIGTNSPLEPG